MAFSNSEVPDALPDFCCIYCSYFETGFLPNNFLRSELGFPFILDFSADEDYLLSLRRK